MCLGVFLQVKSLETEYEHILNPLYTSLYRQEWKKSVNIQPQKHNSWWAGFSAYYGACNMHESTIKI